jgi:outer membrane protein TolC
MRSLAAASAVVASLLAASHAFAQQNPNNQNAGTTPYTQPPPPIATQPAPAPATLPTPAPVTPTPGTAPQSPTRPAGPTPMAPGAPRDTPTNRDTASSNVPDLNTAVAGGITADQVATRAAQTSYQARAAEETANAAGARAEGAWANFIPRVGLTARYTRLSKFTPPSLGSGSIVGTPAPAGTPNPTPTIAASFGPFPIVLDNWLTQATIAIPISDYFLKINQGYSATLHQEEAARFDVVTARAKSYSDGKIAYYTWLRARSSQVVAEQSLTVAKAHLKDAENQFGVGNASKADVMRAQTQAAAAELGVERAKNGVLIAERQVRLAVHAKDEEKLQPGDTLDAQLSPAPTDLKKLVTEAQSNRPELKSLEKNAVAAKKLAEVQLNGRYPVLSGFGDVTYANPNQRRFPQASVWFPTWSVGAQVTWSPNDILTAGPASNDAIARANAIEAQKVTFRDAIDLEVTQAYQSVLEADVAMTSTTRQLESAEEAYRVARELFNAGRGTSTTLIDAETALAQSRFEHLNAKVDAHLARIRLEHALGRDVK